jgi:ABC-2 type transport system ATP-binding protein
MGRAEVAVAEKLVKEYESYEITGFVPMTGFGLYALFTVLGEKLGKYERRVVRALDGVSFTVREGEVVGVLGPNGSGKTTLLKILAGLTMPTRGRAEVAGLDVVRDHERLPRVITYIPGLAAISLFARPEMTVEWNLRRFADLAGLPREAVREALELVELVEDAHRRVYELSTGKLARLAIAFGLVKRSPLYLMDEPFTGVSPEVKVKLLELVKWLASEQGSSVLYATHILSEAEQVCSRVIVLHQGRVIADDTPKNLAKELELMESVDVEVRLAEEAEKLARDLAERADRALKVEVEGEVLKLTVATRSSRDFVQYVVERVHAGGSKLLYVRVREPTLEDVYLALLSKHKAAEEKVVVAPPEVCFIFTGGVGGG